MEGEKRMDILKKEEMISVKGGAIDFSSALLNAMMRTVAVMFSMGQAVGSAIRRAINGNYC